MPVEGKDDLFSTEHLCIYHLMIEQFANMLHGHAPLAISPGESVNQMRILDAPARAARSGEVVWLGDRDWAN